MPHCQCGDGGFDSLIDCDTSKSYPKRWFRQDWKSKPNGKAVVLKTTSNHVKVMCEFESHFFLYDTDIKKRRLGDKP